MGNNLPVVNLGTGKTVKKVALAPEGNHICAILNDDTLKCWGSAASGRLGNASTTAHRGDNANEMGNNLSVIDLGTTSTVTDITLGRLHNCAVLTTGGLKCWGEAGSGQLGIASTADRGDNASEMGNNLPLVDLGAGFTIQKVVAGRDSNCALSTGGQIKCWGLGTSGALLSGGTGSVGTTTGQMGASLPARNLGTGVIASYLSMAQYGGCVITSDDRIKCWGAATGGRLLNGSTTANLGDAGTEVGDNLPYLNH